MEYKNALGIGKLLLNDECNLIDKAAGSLWREIGKHDEKELVAFVDQRYGTMLHYSIEKLNQKKLTIWTSDR